jgi:hypothetical protein
MNRRPDDAEYRASDPAGVITLPTKSNPPASLREVVGTFSDRELFQTAVEALLRAGFARSDLSILSSHTSLDASVGEGRRWRDALTALVGEFKYEGPLVAAGLIAVAAGPIGALIAGLIGAGVGGAAVKELLDEVTALPDAEGFSRALAAGSIILWVAVADEHAEAKAMSTLLAEGAANVHVFERQPPL